MNSSYIYLIETKKEYTHHLCSALSPLVYDGILSIYNNAKETARKGEELKIFQLFLKKIQVWTEHIIDTETNRILTASKIGSMMKELINAVIKSNIMILTNTSPDKKNNIKINHEITTQKFIHTVYIEVARKVYQNPYLFDHKCVSYELKKNQREAIELINKAIKESIRQLLPMNSILQNYNKTSANNHDDFQDPISQHNINNLKSMLHNEKINNKSQKLKEEIDIVLNNKEKEPNDHIDDVTMSFFKQSINKDDIIEVYANHKTPKISEKNKKSESGVDYNILNKTSDKKDSIINTEEHIAIKNKKYIKGNDNI